MKKRIIKVEVEEYYCEYCDHWFLEGNIFICEKCHKVCCYCQEASDYITSEDGILQCRKCLKNH